MPGRDATRHANRGMNKHIRLFADTYQQLTHNMGFPRELSRIGDMLPLTTTIGKLRVLGFDSFGSGTQYFQQFSARVAASFFNDLYPHTFARYATRYKQYTSFIATYGIPAVSKIS